MWMEAIYSQAAAVVICSVIVSMIDLLVSGTAMQQTVRHILGAFMLCALLLPVSSAAVEISQINFHSDSAFEQTDQMQKMQISFLELQMKELAEQTLVENGITPYRTIVHITLTDSEMIDHIDAEIMLFGSDAEKQIKAESILREKLGLSCDITIMEGA